MGIAVRQRRHGFTLVEIMIVVAIIGLLAAVAVPNFVKARTNSQTKVCIKNLQAIDGAKETWALEFKKGSGDPIVEAEVNGYIKGGAPQCPASGVYEYNDLSTPPTCTISGHVIPGGTPTAGTGTGTAGGGTGTGGSAGGGGNSGPGGGSSNSGPGNTNP